MIYKFLINNNNFNIIIHKANSYRLNKNKILLVILVLKLQIQFRITQN